MNALIYQLSKTTASNSVFLQIAEIPSSLVVVGILSVVVVGVDVLEFSVLNFVIVVISSVVVVVFNVVVGSVGVFVELYTLFDPVNIGNL